MLRFADDLTGFGWGHRSEENALRMLLDFQKRSFAQAEFTPQHRGNRDLTLVFDPRCGQLCAGLTPAADYLSMAPRAYGASNWCVALLTVGAFTKLGLVLSNA